MGLCKKGFGLWVQNLDLPWNYFFEGNFMDLVHSQWNGWKSAGPRWIGVAYPFTGYNHVHMIAIQWVEEGYRAGGGAARQPRQRVHRSQSELCSGVRRLTAIGRREGGEDDEALGDVDEA
jgi:hypothetical protein